MASVHVRAVVVAGMGAGPVADAEPEKPASGGPSAKLPEPTPAVAMLDLPDDDFLQGHLVPMAAGDGPLTTLPWLLQADPPTHMLRLPNGDYLRGKLFSLDDPNHTRQSRSVHWPGKGPTRQCPAGETVPLVLFAWTPVVRR